MRLAFEERAAVDYFWRLPTKTALFAAASFHAVLGGNSDYGHSLREFLTRGWHRDLSHTHDDHLRDVLTRLLQTGELIAVTDDSHEPSTRWGPLIAAKPVPVRVISAATVRARSGMAISWLESLRARPEDLLRLRAATEYRLTDTESETVDALVARLRSSLRSEQLIIFVELSSARTSEAPVSRPAPPATPIRESAPPPEDPATFGADSAVATQVHTLVLAAQTGVPFCEICAREAARR